MADVMERERAVSSLNLTALAAYGILAENGFRVRMLRPAAAETPWAIIDLWTSATVTVLLDVEGSFEYEVAGFRVGRRRGLRTLGDAMRELALGGDWRVIDEAEVAEAVRDICRAGL